MKIKTQNSTYELENGLIRKVDGTDNFYFSDQWVKCSFLSYPQEGKRFRFYTNNAIFTTSAVSFIDDDDEKFAWVK